jgi:hypothetical protein
MKVTVPPKSTRYLMVFLQMHDPSSPTPALNDAQKFNKRGLSAALLKGLSSGQKANILNWDLV